MVAFAVMKKKMTEREAEISKARAARFAANVLKDDELADQIADASLNEWADRKGISIENPRKEKIMATKSQLEERIEQLEEELSEYQDREEQLLEILGVEDADDDEDGDSPHDVD
jgi:hypothetical protein